MVGDGWRLRRKWRGSLEEMQGRRLCKETGKIGEKWVGRSNELMTSWFEMRDLKSKMEKELDGE